MPNRYEKLEKKLGITFENRDLLNCAFVHKSYVNEHRDSEQEHNERLEFLGDAVLELTTTEFLYKTYPNKSEGDLTNFRSALVKGKNLAKVAEELDLGAYLYLSKGEEKSGGRKKKYILANTIEAFIGALYLDKGYRVTHTFIDEFILQTLEEILEEGLHIDAKSHFQELSQEKVDITPEYRLISASGPDHAKAFVMAAYLGDTLVGKGTESSKQKAEEAAAREAIVNVKKWENLKK
ncbi:ribonuclease III [Patescibacteria group bacterium]|nr:ribonuclease III [Patescibacteria group bacterium]